jgi:hypothetical protein
MKKSVWCLCSCIVALACFLGAGAQTKDSSSQILDEPLWKTAVQSTNAQACSQCIKRCADSRDVCRGNACGIIGARSNGPQACTNPTNDTPASHKQFEAALKACFDQEKTCDAGCPCQH